MYTFPEYIEIGGLMSYGSNTPQLLRIAAAQVDRILKGADPAELPFEQLSPELLINSKTAKKLGLTIPLELLIFATELIE